MGGVRNETNMNDGPDLHTDFSASEQTVTQADAPQATDYIEDFKGDDYDSLLESEKVELLEALFVVMKSFVNLGHGLDPVNKLIEEFEISSEITGGMIDCEDASDDGK
jgi:hypothetical protein